MPFELKKMTFPLCFLLLGGIGFGQTTNNPAPAQTNTTGLSSDQVEFARSQERRRWEQKQIQQQQQSQRRLEQAKTNGEQPSNANREKPLTKEEIKKIKALLAPNAEDLAKYKDFLDQSKTGLFRLFPNLDCESKNIVRVDGNCANFVPGGGAYSFRAKTYGGMDLFDIRFFADELFADAFLAQEIFVPLGNVPLEDVSLASKGIGFLGDFKPEEKNQEVREQFAKIAAVVKSGDYYYSKRVKAVENMTYALRVVAYRSQEKIIFRSNDELSIQLDKFLAVNDDKRMDIIIAFRIIRKDQNGSISILWKELKRRAAPEIIFQKTEKLTDLKEN
jgi:hypothetical protein